MAASVRSAHRYGIQETVILTMAAAEAGVLNSIATVVNEEKQLRRAVGAVGRPDGVSVR